MTPRRPGRHSQCEKILRVLSDGQPHTSAEIHQLAGFSRLNSRIAELRKRGYEIECGYVGGRGPAAFEYRLLSGGRENEATLSEPVSPLRVAVDNEGAVPAEQLEIFSMHVKWVAA